MLFGIPLALHHEISGSLVALLDARLDKEKSIPNKLIKYFLKGC